MKDYDTNASASRKRPRQSALEEIDEAMYKCFSVAQPRSVSVSGPMIQAEAHLIAEKMVITTSRH